MKPLPNMDCNRLKQFVLPVGRSDTKQRKQIIAAGHKIDPWI